MAIRWDGDMDRTCSVWYANAVEWYSAVANFAMTKDGEALNL